MTALVVFPFTASRVHSEDRVPLATIASLGSGLTLTRDDSPAPGWSYRASFSLRLGAGQTKKTWDEWVQSYGIHEGFLFKAPNLNERTTTDYNVNREVLGEIIGTGDASETDFPTAKKHLDASNITVYLGATPTVAYTLVDNNTTPIIRMDSAPGGGVVVSVDYHFYMPVRLVSWSPPRNTGAHVYRIATVTVTEEDAGAHLADA